MVSNGDWTGQYHRGESSNQWLLARMLVESSRYRDATSLNSGAGGGAAVGMGCLF